MNTNETKTKTYPIIILGSGRSGTTLIQRLLNSYDDTLIWGEHSGFLTEIANSYYLLKKSKSMEEFSFSKQPDIAIDALNKHYKNPELWQAWMNWFNKDDIDDLYRSFIESFFCNNKLGKVNFWGFKEIRYSKKNNQVIKLLRYLYPDIKIIIVTRNGLNVIESQMTTFYGGNSKILYLKRLFKLPLIARLSKKWAEENYFYANLLDENDKNIIHINYDRFTKEKDYLKNKFSLVDKEFTQVQSDVIQMKSGRGSAMRDGTTETNRWKRMGFIPYTLVKLIIKKINNRLGYV